MLTVMSHKELETMTMSRRHHNPSWDRKSFAPKARKRAMSSNVKSDVYKYLGPGCHIVAAPPPDDYHHDKLAFNS